MTNPQRSFKLTRNIDFSDSLCLLIGSIGLISSYWQEKHWMTLFCIGWLAILIYGIKNGKVTVESKFNIEDKKLFEVKDQENNNRYILAESLAEAELLMEYDKLEGNLNYIGKVTHFK